VWKFLLRRPAPAPRETVHGLISRTPDLRELLTSLGYSQPQRTAAAELIGQLNSSIRAEVVDFARLQAAVLVAMAKRQDLPERVSAFLRKLAEAGSEEAVTALLNADPVHDQVPYVEQLPVLRNGVVTWQSPVHHSLIRKRPVDPQKFRDTLAGLETLFSTPHPARSEAARGAVLEGIAKVRQDLDRERSYLPTALQALEAKLADYEAGSLKTSAAESIQALLSIIEAVVKLRNDVGEMGAGEIRPISHQAARYLTASQIQTQSLTGYLLMLLLDRRLVSLTRRVSRSNAKTMDLIRNEIADGGYDGEETARRLRRLDGEGFHIPSIAFPLLQLHGGNPVKTLSPAERKLH
jgi:hypothetical protein